MTSTSRTHHVDWIVTALLGAIAASQLLHALSYWLNVDDAFIAFRYADNFAAGHGLVFNPGEHVEGYTDFLWVALLAFARLFGAPPAVAGQVLGALASIATIPLTWRAGRLLGLGRFSALAPPLVIAASAPVAMWTGGGLETSLYMLLFTAALMRLLDELRHPEDRRLGLAGLLFALATLTRPEGAGVFAVALAMAVAVRQTRGPFLWRNLLAFSLVFLPHLLFRLAYYGYPVPNTFYAKTALSGAMLHDGLLYTGEFLLTHGAWALIALSGLRFLPSTTSRRHILIPLAVLGAAAGYIVLVGGDIYPYSRFCAPYLPWIAILISVGVLFGSRHLSHGDRRVALIATLVIAISMAIPAKLWPDALHRARLTSLSNSKALLRAYGRWFADHYPKSTWLAISSLGRVPYYAGLPTIDMLGLADETIAHRKMALTRGMLGHQKYDSEYLLRRKPKIIALEMASADPSFDPRVDLYTQKIYDRTLPSKGWWPAIEDLLKRRAFRLAYVPRTASIKPGVLFFYFERDDTLRQMIAETPPSSRDPRAHFKLALRFRRQGLIDDAIASLRRVTRLDPRVRSAPINIAYFLHEAGRHQEALAEFLALTKRWSGDPQVRYGVAISLQRLQRYAAAISAWQRFLRIAPRHSFAPRARKMLLEAQRKGAR